MGECQVRNGSYAGWLISSWWCAPHIFCMASSCSLTIYNIINSMIPVPYILLYSYLRSIYYFRMRINLTPPHLIDLIAHFLPLLSVLLTVHTYMRGIKILTNILTKKLVVASSLLRVEGRTNYRGEKSNELNWCHWVRGKRKVVISKRRPYYADYDLPLCYSCFFEYH